MAQSEGQYAVSDKAVVLRGVGLDVLAGMVRRNEVRSAIVSGEQVGSIVDLVARFVPDSRSARKWWNENKQRIVGSTVELSAAIGQLKMTAKDGKSRSTDVAPLWAFIWILARMDTPEANAFMTSYFKLHANDDMSIIRQRFMNISRGLEWAADDIHEQMKALPPDTDGDERIWK